MKFLLSASIEGDQIRSRLGAKAPTSGERQAWLEIRRSVAPAGLARGRPRDGRDGDPRTWPEAGEGGRLSRPSDQGDRAVRAGRTDRYHGAHPWYASRRSPWRQ